MLWLFLVGLLFVCLLLGDVQARRSQANVVLYEKWPMWKTIEAPDNRIRMLWIIHDYVPFVNAGSEICAHTINKYLLKKPYKYDMWVAAPGYPQRTYEGIRCFDLYDTNILSSVLPTTHVIHSHSYVYRKQCQYLSRVMGIPFVEWVHTDNYVRSISHDKWIDPRIQDRQWTAFNSESLKRSGPALPESHTKVVLPIVDFRAYRIDKGAKKPKYVTLSNVNDNKGGHLLVQLAKALPEMKFQGIIGGYRKQIIQSGLPNLRYVPHTSNMKDIYANTWVQIMPSREETWGRTAVEAMSSGIPIIVSPTPGLKECCGLAAIYCDRGNIDAWIVTLQKLKSDKEFYNLRSTLAMERARALDPKPDLENLETWLNDKVTPSHSGGRPLNLLEKNLLFR